jgi:transposase
MGEKRYKRGSGKSGYPSDISDEEWAFTVPYLTLMKEDAKQRGHDLREVFNALRYLARYGCAWRGLPNDFPPWTAVHQQSQRWIKAGVFEALAHDLRKLLRMFEGRDSRPKAAIFDGRTLQSTPESGHRAGYDGYKRKKGSKVHAAVDTLGHLLALKVTAANEQERAQVADLAQGVQEATGESVELVFVDQGYTGQDPASAAESNITLAVSQADAVKLVAAREAGTISAVLSSTQSPTPELSNMGESRTSASDLAALLGLPNQPVLRAVPVMYGDRLVSESPHDSQVGE